MVTAKVFRPERNWKGTVGTYDQYPIGDVTGVVVGGPAPTEIAKFPGIVSTEGMIGVPFVQASGIVLEKGDYLDIGDDIYQVTGPRQWTQANTLTGTPPTHYWVEAQSSH